VRIPYVLRLLITPPELLHTCQACRCRFSETEPGSSGPRERPFPRLCRDRGGPEGRSHVNCGMSGPYCPACAERISAEQAELDEWEKRWQ
jgi:hypothetical protein